MLRLLKAMQVLALTAVPFPSVAQSDTSRLDFCQQWADFSYLTMKMRQDGVSISAALEAANATHASRGSNDIEKDLTNNIIMSAYRLPLEPTDRLADVASIEFSERFFAVCMSRD